VICDEDPLPDGLASDFSVTTRLQEDAVEEDRNGEGEGDQEVYSEDNDA
jgi:hypothetical protein